MSQRDITAHFVSEVCYNVGTELTLQPITDERLYATALPAQRMELMCLLRHKAFGEVIGSVHFDVWVFNLLA